MASVFAKDPNMERNGQAELDRVHPDRKQKQALAALMFGQKKAAPPAKPTDSMHPCGFGLKVPAAPVKRAWAAIKTIVMSAWALEDNSIHAA